MLIAEEFLLLAIDNHTGRPILAAQTIEAALGGALLAELALAERVGITPDSAGWRGRRRITVTSLVPTDDAELDRALATIEAKEGLPAKTLISPMSGKRITKGLSDRLLQRLTEAGALSQERSRALGIFPITRWRTDDPALEAEIRERLHAALIDRVTPTERTVVLIALLQATALLGKVVQPANRKELRTRAKELTDGDWAARAVKEVIEEAAALMASGVAVAAAGSAGS